MAMRKFFTVAGSLAVGALLGGCEPEKPAFEPAVRSTVEVDLPAKPDLVVREYKKSYDDGALTVEGLVRQRKSYLGKEVMVRGVVVDIKKCPEPTEEEIKAYEDKIAAKREELKKRLDRKKFAELPPPPPFKRDRTCNPRPQVQLGDLDKNDRFKLLVAGSMWSPLADLELGETVTLTGRFDISSPDGAYVSQRGVLSLEDKPEPAPASAQIDKEE